MREIKFRAWNKITKQWIDIYVGNNNVVFSIIPRNNEGNLFSANNLIFCQYTGLKDKNAVEIYEGDIVKMHYFSIGAGANLGAYEKENEIVGTIEYRKDFAVYVVSTKENDWSIIEYCQEPGEELEVIGNIYENPELLK